MPEWLSSPEVWAAFATLTILEIVLGIDNIIFISIVTGRLPPEQRARGRFIGLALAMIARIGLLLSLSWIMSLTADFIVVLDEGISGRDVILLAGGAFLIGKATREVHNSLEGDFAHSERGHAVGFTGVMVQIAIIDMVFSLDSVITAVGLVQQIEVMVAAIVISVIIMMLAARSISQFVEEHPTIKMLALSFLILIGFTLMGEGLDLHTPKGYIYFAMVFSFAVEMLNIRAKKKRARLREAATGGAEPGGTVQLRKAQLGDLVGADER